HASGGDVAPSCVPSQPPEHPPQTGGRGSRRARGEPGTDASSLAAEPASSEGCHCTVAQVVYAGRGAGEWQPPCPDCTPSNSQRVSQPVASQGSHKTHTGT